MAESENITIRWEDFREFLDSRGIEIDRELYEYLYAGVENKHVEEMLNDWLKLQ
jgi:ribosomal protein L12E/L44/L45/RPP1/RPP2